MNAAQLIDKHNSLVLKGMAVIMMLIHHLFYSDVSRLRYDDIIIHGHGVINEIGIFCKLCVAVFVFISGYGLATKYRDSFDLKQFYISRFKKLYLNYWFIWLVFVPIGVFFFHRTFTDVYGSHTAVKAVLDFVGLLNLTGQLGYNPTWWFYSCIIVLYLFFPLLNCRFEKNPFILLTVALFATFIGFLPFVKPYSNYLFPFLAGMLMARRSELFDSIGIGESVLSVVLLAVMRNFSGNLVFIVDTLICVGLALLLYRVELPGWINIIMSSLGKHSMNIFLFHTFIFAYWFKDYIYFSRNPLLILLTLLLSCWSLSVAIEFLKKSVGFYRLFQ